MTIDKMIEHVTLIIAATSLAFSFYQYNENKKLQIKEKQINDHKLDADVRKFISEYYQEIDLLPLCPIAMMYEKDFPFHRKMYREYCNFPVELQQKILEYKHVPININANIDLYDICYEKLNNTFNELYYNEKNDLPYYDYGKYLTRSIRFYSNILVKEYASKINIITDITSIKFNKDMDDIEHPIQLLKYKFNFKDCSEEEVCEFACLLVIGTLFYVYKTNFINDIFPDNYFKKYEFYMEDLFLTTLFYIYTRL